MVTVEESHIVLSFGLITGGGKKKKVESGLELSQGLDAFQNWGLERMSILGHKMKIYGDEIFELIDSGVKLLIAK